MNNSLGCEKRFKFLPLGKQKEVLKDCDFICGVANAWGVEKLCLKCDKKLREQWKIEDIHNKNFEIIKKYNLKVGDKLQLLTPYNIKSSTLSFSTLGIGDIFTIKHIHSLYGWITFKETEQLPQEVYLLMQCCKKIKIKKDVRGFKK